MIGENFERIDGAAKATGQARYTADLDIEGCLYGVTVRSTVPHARLIEIKRDPNFDWTDITFVTAADIPGENCIFLNTPDQPALAETEIRHVAEPVALIAARTREIALEARKHVEIITEDLPALLNFRESKDNEIHIYGENNVFARAEVTHGNPQEALESAECVIEGTYYTTHQDQLYLEPQVLLAMPREDGGVVIRGSMQCPYYIQNALGRVLGHNRYNVAHQTTGGAFGGKEEYPSMLAAHAALLCVKSGKPVRMAYRRDEDLLATTKRHPCYARYRTSVDPKTGKFLAADIELCFDGGAYNTLSPVVNSRGVLHAAGAYNWNDVHIVGEMVATHTPPNGAFRGFGAPQSLFAIERHIDKIARTLNIDPIELRRRNLFHAGDETPTGQKLERPLAQEVFDDVFAHAQKTPVLHERNQAPGDGAETRRLAPGRGLVLGWHGAGFTGNGESIFKAKSDVALEGDTVVIYTASTDMGQGLDTVFSAIVADTLNWPLSKIRVATHDTALAPDSGPTAASRSTMVVGGVVKHAAEALIEALREEVGAGPEATFAEMVKMRTSTKTLRKRAEYKGDSVFWDRALNQGVAYPDYAWIALMVDLDVDLDSGEVIYRHLYQCADVGTPLNPQSVSGQLEGGTVQALGWSTLERVVVGPNGAMKNHHLSDYIIPTTIDAPEMQDSLQRVPYEGGPFGAKGMGEMPHDMPAAAVAQAIENATGAILDELPLSPENILRAIAQKAQKEA